MSKLKEIKKLIENLGYKVVSIYLSGYGLVIDLVGIRNGKLDKETFYIEPSDSEYAEILYYTVTAFEKEA